MDGLCAGIVPVAVAYVKDKCGEKINMLREL